MVIFVTGTVVLGCLRALFLAWAVSRSGWVALPFVLIEGAALLLGIINLLTAPRLDTSWGGVWVPVAYAGSALALPGVAMTDVGAFVGLGSMVLTAWALWHLRACFTFGGSSWVRLVDSGPYGIIRHPMAAGRVLAIMAMISGAGSPADVSRCLFAVALSLSVVLVEERFLSSVREYREYVERVPDALVPGVI